VNNSDREKRGFTFQSDTPLNEILEKMISRMHVGKIYNPAAPYVRRRKFVVDWMCEVGEELKYQSDAINHSIALFDAYFSIPGIEDI
jgi:hypothetical protein